MEIEYKFIGPDTLKYHGGTETAATQLLNDYAKDGWEPADPYVSPDEKRIKRNKKARNRRKK